MARATLVLVVEAFRNKGGRQADKRDLVLIGRVLGALTDRSEPCKEWDVNTHRAYIANRLNALVGGQP